MPLDSSLRWNDINIHHTSRYIRDTTLVLPAGGIKLIYIDMTEMPGIYMKVCLAAGIALAMPYLVYQVIMFMAPTLTPKEKRCVLLVLPWVFLMFAGGVAFSYFVLMSPAVRFLLTFGDNIAIPQIRIGSYITVVTRVILATGGIFELPVVSTFLARLGVITPGWLASKRKMAMVMAFVLAALITPTFDPINQSLVAMPLIVLYEMSIWLAKLVQPRRLQTAVSSHSPVS
ncbi:MAG: twin-arginine translocase subunit TatC [Chloroflexota bacterium]|nr:twin-arginine translocase subunit TatC [Chloroflexota bacterium]